MRRSSLAEVHREFVHHIVEDEVDGQEEGQDDKREDGEQREESGVVEESQNKHMKMTLDVRTTNTHLEPRMCVYYSEKMRRVRSGVHTDSGIASILFLLGFM